jgi:hypothetical protein
MRMRTMMGAILVLALVVAVPASAGPLWQASGHAASLDRLTFGLWSQVVDGLARVDLAVDGLRPERIGARPHGADAASSLELDGDEELRPERIGWRGKPR